MLSGVDDVTDSDALGFGGILPFQQLPESENRIQRRAQFMTDTGEEFILGGVCPLYFLDPLPMGYVFNRTLVVGDRPARIANGPGILADPNLTLIFAVNFIFEEFHKSVLFN